MIGDEELMAELLERLREANAIADPPPPNFERDIMRLIDSDNRRYTLASEFQVKPSIITCSTCGEIPYVGPDARAAAVWHVHLKHPDTWRSVIGSDREPQEPRPEYVP